MYLLDRVSEFHEDKRKGSRAWGFGGRIFIFYLLSLILAGCGARQSTRLPELQLTSIDSGIWNLQDEAGRVVVLQFFATFDNSSIALATTLEQIHIAYSERGVSVVGVAMDPTATARRREIVETYCGLNNITFEVVLASDELAEGETSIGRIPTIPATVIFDQLGTPVASATGVFQRSELEGLLDALIEGRPHPLLQRAF